MSAPRESPSPLSSYAGSLDESDYFSSRNQPYTPDELAAVFLDFYTFLTTLHYDAADLKRAPPGGWPGLTPELCPNFKSDYAIEVLRRLPYFHSEADVHYKSILLDYTSFDRNGFEEQKLSDEQEELETIEGEEADPMDVICIAEGHESGGRNLFLNVQDGSITEEMGRCGRVCILDVKDYFDALKEEYLSLKIIPCLGRDTIEAMGVNERADEVTKEQFHAQTVEDRWPTDLDVQYIRQIYRQHEWPHAFRKDDAKKAIDDLVDLMQEEGAVRHCDWY